MKPSSSIAYTYCVIAALLLVTLYPYQGDAVTPDQAISTVSTMSDTIPGLDDRPLNTTCIAPARPSVDTSIALERAFPNLVFSDLVAMLQAPGDASRSFVVERTGRVRTFVNDDTVTDATIFLDISDRVEWQTRSGGLLGMAFHPDFASNGQVFLAYLGIGKPWATYISRFTSKDGGTSVDAASEQVLIVRHQKTPRHVAGHMAFGTDGYLYIGLGDGSQREDVQDRKNLYGAMLRIDVDGGEPYAIPPDNPFVSGDGRPEIYAWGFRNPWRWSFDRATGELWVGDVGASSWEEVNLVERGGNYGWPIREGAHCRQPSCDSTGLIDPRVEYGHDEGQAVVGGYVYHGTAVPELQGVYLYGDVGQGRIWGLSYDQQGQPKPRVLIDSVQNEGGLRAFAEDHNGELFVLMFNVIYRLVSGTTEAKENTFPQSLSATGCVDPINPTQPATGLIPYDVNVPLWSDGASKQRWLALPQDATIHITAGGNWEFPIGSVLLKSFSFAGALVETRLLVRHEDGGWAGYSYEWNNDQTDAVLLAGGKTKILSGQNYSIPSRAQCLQCHTVAAGHTLGLETAQMNRTYLYPTTGRIANQLATFDHLGLFDAPLPALPTALPVLPQTTDQNQPVAARARAYLHANCGNCHRPNGPGGGPADFRFATSELAMGVCNVPPELGNLGVPGARLIVPGAPMQSIVSLRMHALDFNRMPPLGSNVVDAEGTELIDSWISSLQQCP